MKCGKSSKTKKSRSASGSSGTVPGCRAASSATIRGDAEPTWCTCSSALGRPAMKSITASSCQRRSNVPRSAETPGGCRLLGQPAQCQQQWFGQDGAEHHVAHGGGRRVGGHGGQLELRDLFHVVPVELQRTLGQDEAGLVQRIQRRGQGVVVWAVLL